MLSVIKHFFSLPVNRTLQRCGENRVGWVKGKQKPHLTYISFRRKASGFGQTELYFTIIN
jgi:hypothetical protein